MGVRWERASWEKRPKAAKGRTKGRNIGPWCYKFAETEDKESRKIHRTSALIKRLGENIGTSKRKRSVSQTTLFQRHQVAPSIGAHHPPSCCHQQPNQTSRLPEMPTKPLARLPMGKRSEWTVSTRAKSFAPSAAISPWPQKRRLA